MSSLPELPGLDALVTGAANVRKYQMWLYGRTGGYSLAKVSFFNGQDLFEVNGNTPGDPLGGDLRRVRTEKDLSNPAGAFSITMHNRRIRTPGAYQGKTLYEAINPNDLVILSFRRIDPVGNRLVVPASPTLGYRNVAAAGPDAVPADTGYVAHMVGVVGPKPRFHTGIGRNGAAEHQVTIQGCDLGKLLLNCQIYWFKDVPSADIRDYALKGRQLLAGGTFPGGERRDLMKAALEEIFYKITSLGLKMGADQDQLADVKSILGYRLGETVGVLPVGLNFFSQEETMWAFMEAIAEKPWCELFVDTWPQDDLFESTMSPGTATHQAVPGLTLEGSRSWIVMRQSPFDRSYWSALPAYYIDQSVVEDYDVGGEPTIYNLFYAYPSDYLGMGSAASAYLTGVPHFDEASFKKFGLRSLICESKMWPYGKPGSDIKAMGKQLTDLLYAWYKPSEKFLSGTFRVQGHPAYRMGTRLYHTGSSGTAGPGSISPDVDLSGEYYVEGVTQDWTGFESYVSDLRVTRGLPLVNGQPDWDTRFPVVPAISYDKPSMLSSILDANRDQA